MTVKQQSSAHTTLAPRDDVGQHFFPLLWLLVMSVVVFGVYVAYDLGFFQRVFAIDRSYLSLVIILMFIAASVHAVWHIVSVSARIVVAKALLNRDVDLNELVNHVDADHNNAPGLMMMASEYWMREYVVDLRSSEQAGRNAARDDADTQSVVEIYADKLRSPVELGWYVVDLAIRFGLIGTIVGFILIFSSLSGNTVPGTDELQSMLISMSTGMGTALYTTLCGLVAATFLGVQYLILGRGVEHLIGQLFRIRNLDLSGVETSASRQLITGVDSSHAASADAASNS